MTRRLSRARSSCSASAVARVDSNTTLVLCGLLQAAGSSPMHIAVVRHSSGAFRGVGQGATSVTTGTRQQREDERRARAGARAWHLVDHPTAAVSGYRL